MKSNRSICCAVAAGLLLLAASGTAFAAACTAVASTAWNVRTTWGTAATGCAGATDGVTAGIPGAGDTVSIGVAGTPRAVTIPAGYTARAASLAIGGTTTNGVSALTLSAATSTLIVGGNVSVSAPNNNNVNALNVNAGNATVNGSITLTEGTTNARISRVAIASGSLTVNGTAGNNGDIVMNNASADARTQISVSSTGSITVTRSFVLSNGFGTLSMTFNGSTFTYSTGSAASVATGPAISYKNLTINKTGGTATALNTPAAPRALTVTGNLLVSAGTLDVNDVTTAVTGTTTVSGTLAITSATGAKTFTGDVTVNGTGTWNNSGNAAVAMGGSLTNNGTFTSGTGDYTFQTTAARAWSGSSGITFSGNVIVSASRTNNTTTTINGVLTCDAALTNGDGVTGRTLTVGGNLAGKLSVTNSASSTVKVGGDVTIATLTATATDNTVEYNGAGAQSVKNTAYYHLTINSGGAATLANDISVAGNLSNNGQLNAISGNYVVTFNGNVAQSLLGAATNTTVYRLTINNTAALADRKLTASHDITVNNLLTLTSGRIVMSGTAKTVIPAGASIFGAAGSPDNRFVAGRLQKNVPNANPTVTFEIGTDGATEPSIGYSPVTLAFTGASAGGLIAYATLNDHPNIGTSTLDDTQSVNRYWTLNTSGVTGAALSTFTSYDATFTFVNGSATDVDSGANTAVFETERWDGAAWNVTAVGTRTSTSTQALAVTATSDFAVAKKKAGGGAVGGFNAMDTPTCAVSGVIKTKVSGIATSLNIVALNSTNTAIQTNFNSTVRVELMNAADNTGYPDANGCGPNWTVIQQLADVAFSAPDNGCKATASFAENNAYREVRVRITDNPGKPAEKIGCSGDNFAIRPNAFANLGASDTDWQTAGTGRALSDATFGAVTHKAGRPFSVRATAVNGAGTPATTTNYTGAPTAMLTTCAGAACTATTGALTLNTTFAAGALTSDVATYNEVGSFALKLVDSTFANVDAADGSTAAERNIESATINVGRFVPDHFAVALNTPQFGAACGGSATYIGQSFSYTTAPQITVTAQDFSNNTTALYTGNWWRITNASVTPATQAARYSAATGTLDVTGLPAVATDPTIVDASGGSGTLTFGSGTGFAFSRTAPVAPFDADISVAVNVIDGDNVAYASNPARFGQATAGNGIGFSAGKSMRFGRLVARNANGSQLVPQLVQLETQYWGYTNPPTNTVLGFITNTADSCTAIAADNVAFGNYTGNLSPAPNCKTAVSGGGAFSSGRKSLLLAASGSGNNGSANLTVNLGASASGNTCTTVGAAPGAATTANRPYLQGQWDGVDQGSDGLLYDDNPTARATFGAYRGAEEVIFIRENF